MRQETDPQAQYEILRALTSPIVAVTVRDGDRTNGMVANSAIRASLVPGRQRVALYVFKHHLTHELLVRTGRFGFHILSRQQWDEIWSLGFQSGREAPDKVDRLPHRISESTGLPMLTGSWAWLECRVVNVMDAGSSTFFMGEISRMGRGSGEEPMDSAFFRSHMPAEWRPIYEAKLREAQEMAARLPDEVDDRPWRELRGGVGAEGHRRS